MGLSGALRWKGGCELVTDGTIPLVAWAFLLSPAVGPRLPAAICDANVAFFLLTVTCSEIATGPHTRRAESCPDINCFWLH